MFFENDCYGWNDRELTDKSREQNTLKTISVFQAISLILHGSDSLEHFVAIFSKPRIIHGMPEVKGAHNRWQIKYYFNR